MYLNPIGIYGNNAANEKSEIARISTLTEATGIGDLVKSCLGPKGMDKVLINCEAKSLGNIEITNDGATILKKIDVSSPVAKMLVNTAKAQDSAVGDGTTSVVVLASELLKEADALIEQKFHPQVILQGWHKSTKIAYKALEEQSVDTSSKETFKEDLLRIAYTTLGSKILSQHKQHFATLAVEAVFKLEPPRHESDIQILKIKGGVLEDSFLEEGFSIKTKLEAHQPKRIENPKILVACTMFNAESIKDLGSSIRASNSLSCIEKIQVYEREKLRNKVNKILDLGINLFINKHPINDFCRQLFTDAGVMAVEYDDLDGIQQMAAIFGTEVLPSFDRLEWIGKFVGLGKCEVVEQYSFEDTSILRFKGVSKKGASTIIIRGATEQIRDEAERSLKDVFSVLLITLGEPGIVYGGGSSEALMANAIMEEAIVTPTKESMVMESFAKALLQLPFALADNAGYDAAQLLSELKAAHKLKKSTYGLDFTNGKIACMKELGITESFSVKNRVLYNATEAAEAILRVNHIMVARQKAAS